MKIPATARRPLNVGDSADKPRPGLSNLLDRRQLWRISRDGIPRGAVRPVRSLRVLPSALDIELSHAVDVAFAQHRPLVAILPLPLPAAPMVMAAAATIAAIAGAGRIQARTAVVSSRLAGRQIYDELLVDREQLSVQVPRSMAGEHYSGSTVVTAHDCDQLLSLESLDELTGLVLDLNAVSPGDLDRVLKHMQHRSPRRPMLALAMTASPLDRAVDLIRQANGLVYAVDLPALARHASAAPIAGPGDGLPLVCAAGDLMRAAGASMELRDCGDSALDDAVARLWAATASLSMATVGAPSAAKAANLRWAWAVTSAFSLLATSAARADHHSQRGPWAPPSLLEAPRRARDLAVNENEFLWLRWAEAADAAVEASGPEHKTAAVARMTAAHASAGQPVLVLTRNRAASAALTSALIESAVAPSEVHVASMRDFAASRTRVAADALVVTTGPPPRAFAGWLTVPPAAGLLVLTAGPQQTLRAARQVIDARGALSRERRAATASGLVVDVSWSPRNVHLEVPPVQATAKVTQGGITLAFEASGGEWDDRVRRLLERRARHTAPAGEPDRTAAGQGLWTPFRDDALAALERFVGRAPGTADQPLDDADGFAGSESVASATNSGVPVMVVPLTLRPLGGGDDVVLLQPPAETLTRRDGLQVKAVAARALRAGDLVALVDGQARQDLFGHVVDTLEESPEWGVSVALARLWQQCVRRIPDSGLSYEEIRQRAGISVQANTIGTWARGQTECPLDPQDVRRLARVLEDDEVLSRADAVATALRAIWKLHQKAGRWLSSRLAEASRAGLGDDAIRGRTRDEVLDPALGLRASDLLGSIRLYRVTAVDAPCTAPSGATGRPIPPRQAAALCSSAAGATITSAVPMQHERPHQQHPPTAGPRPAKVVNGVIEGLSGAPLDDEEGARPDTLLLDPRLGELPRVTPGAKVRSSLKKLAPRTVSNPSGRRGSPDLLTAIRPCTFRERSLL